MKSKKISVQLLALHGLLLAGFLLTQGCATRGKCPIDWLVWPYNAPNQEAMTFETDDYIVDSTDAILLPPDYSSAPYETIDMPMAAAETYTVQKGDTLSAVASMYGTTWKKLAEYNNLSNPNKLYVGQKISIPGSLDAVAPAPVARPDKPSASVQTSGAPIAQGTSYVIQRGDTLSGIAKRSGLSVDEIKAANALTSHIIIAGKSLSIPKKGEVVTVTVPSETFSEPVEVDVAAPTLAPIADIAPVATSVDAPVYEHVLYPGETIEDVARQYGSSKEEIMLLNAITDPDAVKPGTKLNVPIPE